MELSKEAKNQLIEQRLNQYKQQIFSFEMDIVALEAIGDKEGIKSIQEKIDALRAAYKAVEGMKETK